MLQSPDVTRLHWRRVPLGWLFIKHLPDMGALLSPAAGSIQSCSQEPRQDGHGLAPPGAALLQPSQTQGAAAWPAQHSSDFFVGLQKHEPNPSPALGHTCSAPGVLELLGRLGEVSATASHQQHRSGQTHGDSHRLEIWGLCLTWNQINIEQTAPELSQ